MVTLLRGSVKIPKDFMVQPLGDDPTDLLCVLNLRDILCILCSFESSDVIVQRHSSLSVANRMACNDKKISCEWMCLCEMIGCSKAWLGEITCKTLDRWHYAYLYPWIWWIWVMKRSSLTDVHMIASHALKGHRAPQSSPPQSLIWLPCEISNPQISLASKSSACALAQNRMEILTCLPS